MNRKTLVALTAVPAMSIAMAACGGTDKDAASGGTSSSSGGPVKVMYQRTEGIVQLDAVLNTARDEYLADHPDADIVLEPIEAAEDDYATQLALSLQSPSTAPCIFYQDTFRVRSDAEAGYLAPLGKYLDGWEDWDLYYDAAKEAGRDDDGEIYAIPLDTDTRGIWYNKKVLETAGIALPWHPANWQEILDAAAKIKETQPDVVPFHMYAGKPAGEGTAMQSFLPLLYGTGDRLYDSETQKWITGSKGFEDSLAFLQTLYEDGYAVPVSEALDGNLWQTFFDWRFPEGKLGAVLEGSYGGSFWEESGPYPWAQYVDEMDVTGFPTEDGGEGGVVSMMGGWTLAMTDACENKDGAFDFLKTVFSFQNALDYTVNAGKIAVREDVAEAPEYKASGPFVEFFTDLVDHSFYRPATADYPQISQAIQEATENVVTGKMSPAQAAEAYSQAVERIVGADNVQDAS